MKSSTPRSSASSPRALALRILARADADTLYANLVLDTTLRRYSLSEADRSLLCALTYGVLEKQLTLDYLIGLLSRRPADTLDPQVRILLRMGLYQLRWMDRIPPHAALNETVALAPARARGFVNAVLRTYTREGNHLPFPDPATDPIAYLSVTYSFPEPLCRRFLTVFGRERTERLLAAANCPPPLTLRVHTLRTSPEALTARLRAAGYTVSPGAYLPTVLSVPGGNPTAMPGFAEGEFFVQDEASQICVRALDAHPGMTVLDICACPGSKSFGAAIDMEDRGRLLAFDLHTNKLSLISSGAARLGLSSISVSARDGRDFDPSLAGIGDRVLCDVPCSGLGVMAKKPEIRYKNLDDAAALPDIQLAIAENACRYVRPGGILLYSTCTLLPEENEKNVARFLARHPDFQAEGFTVGSLRSEDGMLTLTPDRTGTDGFFMAKLRRNTDHG